jgi:hypothetical protein
MSVEDLGGGRLQVLLEEDGRENLFQIVVEERATLLELRPRSRSLEEIYLRYFQE